MPGCGELPGSAGRGDLVRTGGERDGGGKHRRVLRSATTTSWAGSAGSAAESSTYYLLGYQPEKAPDGNWRELRSESRFALGSRFERVAATKPRRSPPWPHLRPSRRTRTTRRRKDPSGRWIRRCSDSSHGDAIPLRVASYVLDADKERLARVLVVLEMDRLRGSPSTVRASGRPEP